MNWVTPSLFNTPEFFLVFLLFLSLLFYGWLQVLSDFHLYQLFIPGTSHLFSVHLQRLVRLESCCREVSPACWNVLHTNPSLLIISDSWLQWLQKHSLSKFHEKILRLPAGIWSWPIKMNTSRSHRPYIFF